MLSLAGREQQILDGIETALQAGETRLTSMFAMFTRLSGDEERPGTEKLEARNWLRAPRAAGRPRRNAWWRSTSRAQWATGRPTVNLRIVTLIPVVLAAIVLAVLLGMITASMDACAAVNAGHTYQRALSRAGTCQSSPPVPALGHGP